MRSLHGIETLWYAIHPLKETEPLQQYFKSFDLRGCSGLVSRSSQKPYPSALCSGIWGQWLSLIILLFSEYKLKLLSSLSGLNGWLCLRHSSFHWPLAPACWEWTLTSLDRTQLGSGGTLFCVLQLLCLPTLCIYGTSRPSSGAEWDSGRAATA